MPLVRATAASCTRLLAALIIAGRSLQSWATVAPRSPQAPLEAEQARFGAHGPKGDQDRARRAGHGSIFLPPEVSKQSVSTGGDHGSIFLPPEVEPSRQSREGGEHGDFFLPPELERATTAPPTAKAFSEELEPLPPSEKWAPPPQPKKRPQRQRERKQEKKPTPLFQKPLSPRGKEKPVEWNPNKKLWRKGSGKGAAKTSASSPASAEVNNSADARVWVPPASENDAVYLPPQVEAPKDPPKKAEQLLARRAAKATTPKPRIKAEDCPDLGGEYRVTGDTYEPTKEMMIVQIGCIAHIALPNGVFAGEVGSSLNLHFTLKSSSESDPKEVHVKELKGMVIDHGNLMLNGVVCTKVHDKSTAAAQTVSCRHIEGTYVPDPPTFAYKQLRVNQVACDVEFVTPTNTIAEGHVVHSNVTLHGSIGTIKGSIDEGGDIVMENMRLRKTHA